MAKNFAELRAKMAVSAREEAQRQTQAMLAEIPGSEKTDFLVPLLGTANQNSLARLLLQVKARKPLAGDELR